MAMLSSVFLQQGISLLEIAPTTWFMESVYADTTLQVNTVSSVLLSIMTDPGSQLMESLERHTNVKSVNAMDMPKAATLTGHPGESLASVVEVCVTVCTTQRAVNVRSARLASTEIPNDLTLLLTPANHVSVTPWVLCPSTWLKGHSVTHLMETASANREWVVSIVTDAWWDTGASTSMAADPVTVQETVIPSLEIAC